MWPEIVFGARELRFNRLQPWARVQAYTIRDSSVAGHGFNKRRRQSKTYALTAVVYTDREERARPFHNMAAAKALREADARRESIFAQSVDAQRNKDDVMAKKFAEAVKKAKETPLTDRPLREFDLD